MRRDDAMAKLAEQAKEDEALLADANRRDDSDNGEQSEISSDDEMQRANQWTFDSAIDVGSEFLNLKPESELVFQII